jgi:ribonuclease BN (tRNA processing enzyme)
MQVSGDTGVAELIPLGVNGYLPLGGCHTSCFLLLFEDTAFLLDAGTGAARLHEPAIRRRLERYDALHVVLSHYHVDHTCGLYYAFTAWRERPLVVHAPVAPLVDAVDAEAAIARYFMPPLNSFRLEDSTIRVQPLAEPLVNIGSHRLRVWSQQHPGGSIGLCMDERIAYVTDAVLRPGDAEQVRGVDCLLHELWLTETDAAAQPAERQRHACVDGLLNVMQVALPKRVMPIHLYPHYSLAERQALADALQEAAGVEVIVPVEGQVYRL